MKSVEMNKSKLTEQEYGSSFFILFVLQ